MNHVHHSAQPTDIRTSESIHGRRDFGDDSVDEVGNGVRVELGGQGVWMVVIERDENVSVRYSCVHHISMKSKGGTSERIA